MAIDTKKLRELAEKAGSGEWSATDGIVWFDDGDGALKVMNPIPTFFAFDNMGAWPDAIESDDVAAYAAAACPKAMLTLLDEIDALRKDAERMAWQPIETAPKDGSMFLGWVSAVLYGESDEGAHFETDVSETDFCRWQSSETDGYFEGLSGPRGDAEHVTHWMPLPDAPKVDAALALRESGKP